MYIKSNTFAVVFRLIFIMVCGAGLIMKLLYSGFSIDLILSDFALVTGVAAILYFIYPAAARPGYERGALRGAVTIYMIIVFVTYYFMSFGTSGNPLANLDLAGFLLYYASPIIAFLDYILFCRKGEFSVYSPLIWTVLPVIFNIVVYVVNRMGLSMASVPYFNLLGLSLPLTFFLFLGIGYLLFVADDLMSRRG